MAYIVTSLARNPGPSTHRPLPITVQWNKSMERVLRKAIHRIAAVFTAFAIALIGSWSSTAHAAYGVPVVTGAQWAQNADGRLEIYAVGLDRQMYHIWQKPGGLERMGSVR